MAALAVFFLALAALIPTIGDFGLSWDEPAYRYSQVLSAEWWEQLGQVRNMDQLETLFDPLTLLYYWPYGRYGINFHPPLAGQLNLATYAIFGGSTRGHSCAADGDRARVCDHDRDRLSLPGKTLRRLGRGRDGGLTSPDAAGLRSVALD